MEVGRDLQFCGPTGYCRTSQLQARARWEPHRLRLSRRSLAALFLLFFALGVRQHGSRGYHLSATSTCWQSWPSSPMSTRKSRARCIMRYSLGQRGPGPSSRVGWRLWARAVGTPLRVPMAWREARFLGRRGGRGPYSARQLWEEAQPAASPTHLMPAGSRLRGDFPCSWGRRGAAPAPAQWGPRPAGCPVGLEGSFPPRADSTPGFSTIMSGIPCEGYLPPTISGETRRPRKNWVNS